MHITPSTPTTTAVGLGLAPTLLKEPITPTPVLKSRQHPSMPVQLLTPASSQKSMNDTLLRRGSNAKHSSPQFSAPSRPTTFSGSSGTHAIVNSNATGNSPSAHDHTMSKYFKIQDMLITHYPRDAKVPYPSICTLGGQSAGKSSVLSALLNVGSLPLAGYRNTAQHTIDLWCAEGMATHGPTRIASRRGGTSFKASISIIIATSCDKMSNIIDFGEIYRESDMVEAMHLAGEEARYADGGWRSIRSWTQLKAMSEAEKAHYKDEASKWTNITENVVSVTVFGPSQPQFDIYDLPGTNGDPKIKNLVAKYISQPYNIILLCLPGGGRDASPDDPEVQLVRENDPSGSRTLAVITRADETSADPEDRSTWIPYILGETNTLGITPTGGIWPVQCRSRKQRRTHITLADVRTQEKALFAEKDWEAVQAQAGRRFGIDALSTKLEEVFAAKIQENYVAIRQLLRIANQDNAEWLEANPAIEDPIATLHDDVIHAFADQLQRQAHRSNANGKLYDLHASFLRVVTDDVPEFVAFSQDEEEGRAWKSFFQEKGYTIEGRDKVYMDTLLDLIKANTSKRDPNLINTEEIVQDLLNQYSAQWKATALAHVDTLWTEVKHVQNKVAQAICTKNRVLVSQIQSILEQLSASFIQDTRQFILTMHKIHSASPSDLRLSSHNLLKAMHKATVNHFRNQYSNNILKSIEADLIGLASPQSLSSAVPRLLDETYTPQEREKCFDLQASLATSLFGNATEFSSVVSQFAQLQVLEYVKQVSRTLRKGMMLEQVQEEVHGKAQGWLESDKHIRKERKRRLEEAEQNAELERQLTLAFEDE
ncbi:hypothetical protein IAT40_004016 [Kwoniella sp. CBS 6097]